MNEPPPGGQEEGRRTDRGSPPTEPRPVRHHDDLPVDPDLPPERGRAPGRWPSGAVLAAVAAGGALGAPARYLVAEAVTSPADGFPLATFLTNTGASFALG